jgi:hypothetical protein
MSCGGTTPTPPHTHPPTDCFAIVVSPFLLFVSPFLDSLLHGDPESLQSGTTFSSLFRQVDLVEKVRVVMMYRGRGLESKITLLKWWSVWS